MFERPQSGERALLVHFTGGPEDDVADREEFESRTGDFSADAITERVQEIARQQPYSELEDVEQALDEYWETHDASSAVNADSSSSSSAENSDNGNENNRNDENSDDDDRNGPRDAATAATLTALSSSSSSGSKEGPVPRYRRFVI